MKYITIITLRIEIVFIMKMIMHYMQININIVKKSLIKFYNNGKIYANKKSIKDTLSIADICTCISLLVDIYFSKYLASYTII